MIGDSELDAVERSIDIEADAARVWALISRPGWWINDGEILQNACIEQRGDWHVIRDPRHGAFAVQVVRLEPPGFASFRWKRGEPEEAAASTLVELSVVERPGGVRLTVVESGFAQLSDDRDAWTAFRAGNSEGWRIELDAAASSLARDSVACSAYLPAGCGDGWPYLVDGMCFAHWYAFGGARIEAVPGGRIELRWDVHGAFWGRVREVRAQERFSFVLALEPDVEPLAGASTLVTLELRRYGSRGTLLSIRQTGYAELREELGGSSALADQDRASWQAGLVMLAERFGAPERVGR